MLSSVYNQMASMVFEGMPTLLMCSLKFAKDGSDSFCYTCFNRYTWILVSSKQLTMSCFSYWPHSERILSEKKQGSTPYIDINVQSQAFQCTVCVHRMMLDLSTSQDEMMWQVNCLTFRVVCDDLSAPVEQLPDCSIPWQWFLRNWILVGLQWLLLSESKNPLFTQSHLITILPISLASLLVHLEVM